MNLAACLPAHLQGPATTITRIAAGLSGAAVYRVDAAGQTFVLKIAREDEPVADWRCKAHIQQLAAHADVAPRVIHVDESRRAIVTAFIVDRSFPAYFGDPRTREAALVKLARVLRRVHGLALPPDAESKAPATLLSTIWAGLAGFPLPAFVGDAVDRVLGEPAPARDSALVLSHGDVNPSNLIYDGEHVRLLDWDMAGANDPFYDLATISIFLRMDVATCERLVAAYNDAPVAPLPARFAYYQRLVAATCGVLFLHIARHGGHTGATGEQLDTTLELGDLYPRMRAGTLSAASPDGQWLLGLALVKASAAH